LNVRYGWRDALSLLPGITICAAAAFGLGAGASFIPVLDRGGLLVLGAGIAFLAVSLVVSSLNDGNRYLARLGSTMAGGFVTALLILSADLLIKIST
jgi:hypothetical protein